MKSKKLLSIILALAMMFSVLPASTVLVHAEAQHGMTVIR